MDSVVILSFIVGLALVLQHIPLVRIGAPPSSVALPPDVAVVYEISVTAFVVITGGVVLFFVHPLKTNINRKKIEILREGFIVFKSVGRL